MKTRETLNALFEADPGKNNICNRLDVTDFASLSCTSTNLNQFFKNRPKSFWLEKLAYYILQEPNKNKVRFILNKDLNFLNHVYPKIQMAKSLQTFVNITPLQISYSVGDHVMIDMLQSCFNQLNGAKQARHEVQKQISKMKVPYAQKFDFHPILLAIKNESFNHGRDPLTNKLILSPATLAAIKNFKKDFDKSQPSIIGNEDVCFRWKTLQELYDHYIQAAKAWNNILQSALFEDAVLAYVLGYVPKNGAQYFSQGLYYLQKEDPELFKHASKTRDGQDFYAALKKPSAVFLLEGSYIDILFGVQRPEKQDEWLNTVPLGSPHNIVTQFLSNKDLELKELTSFSKHRFHPIKRFRMK